LGDWGLKGGIWGLEFGIGNQDSGFGAWRQQLRVKGCTNDRIGLQAENGFQVNALLLLLLS